MNGAFVDIRPDPQALAADPAASVFLAANAGTGKTTTLVSRVARLLLAGARSQAVLCVTYTKAAASEMQRRFYHRLGGWAVTDDDTLRAELGRLQGLPPESFDAADLSGARTLFARALETPGGLRVQTIHAFAEALLRRFPLEAGVPPRFTVMDDVASAAIAAAARDEVARLAMRGEGAVAAAYARLSVALDGRAFEEMFAGFAAERTAIASHVERVGLGAGLEADVWRRCGFPDGPVSTNGLRAEAVARTDWPAWRRAAEALVRGNGKTDGALGLKLADLAEQGPSASFDALWAVFCKADGEARVVAKMTTNAVDPFVREWLAEEQARLGGTARRIKDALVAEDTLAALTLAAAHTAAYAEAKRQHGVLDFADLITRTRDLLRVKGQAAWVLYKLDGGVDHVLVDEAQDTAPEQWDILRALTEEFFSGEGVERAGLDRTVFAVGDEKQSIYSFQGARPERLSLERRDYISRVTAADRLIRTPHLETSWRSTPEVLRFVDAVFAQPAALAGVRPRPADEPPAAETEGVRHVTTREGQAGSVELWPLLAEAETEETDPYEPLDREPPDSARKRLAAAIVNEIQGAVRRGDGVWEGRGEAARLRPVGYGDILVLVQRRDATFEEILRALKLRGVPVAGADRLRLSEHGAFQDLMALVRFVLFPNDDLTLATLLRSPFCDVDEEGLYALAHGRGRHQRLWRVLRDRAGERPEWAAAAELLGWARGERRRAPFDFLGRALERPDAGGRSVRARFFGRMGEEAQDALNETLAQALAAETRGVYDLESFAAAMSEVAVEVKRELEEPRGQVRVMTVHGAKGLEAPVVILPDTTAKPRVDGPALLKTGDGAFLWCSSKKADCDASNAARLLREQARRDESMRLLYVALTRARDRLIVCGRLDKVQSKKGLPAEDSWYAVAEAALAHPSIAGQVRTAGGLRRFGADPAPASVLAPLSAPAQGESAPDWLHRPAARERARGYTSPTRLARAGGAAPSPLTERSGLGRFRRGDLIHKLLELLPDLPPAEREAAAAAYLAKQPGLDEAQRAEMAEAALGVLRDPAFAPVFGPGSRAEAALAGAVPGLPPVSGRVDRLVVEPGRVLVVDFKTNRDAPATVEAVDPAYLDQMATYTALLRAVFPGRAVEAALLWTDGPRLMPIPTALINERLSALRVD